MPTNFLTDTWSNPRFGEQHLQPPIRVSPFPLELHNQPFTPIRSTYRLHRFANPCRRSGRCLLQKLDHTLGVDRDHVEHDLHRNLGQPPIAGMTQPVPIHLLGEFRFDTTAYPELLLAPLLPHRSLAPEHRPAATSGVCPDAIISGTANAPVYSLRRLR